MFTQSFGSTAPALRCMALLLALFVVQDSRACYSAPAHQLIGVDEQIRLAKDVALAQAVSATPLGGRDVEYRFRVLERLAGQERSVFTVVGQAPESGELPYWMMGRSVAPSTQDSSFDHHAAPAFWARGGGRTMNGGDCSIRPSFVIGGFYLVFLGSAPTWRSFEKIDFAYGKPNENDKWLAYVKNGLGRRDSAATGPAPD